MPLIDPGTPAPPFALDDQHGVTHTLDQYRGRSVVLYFYPKDATPGCTREACDFEAVLPAARDAEVVILGVSVLDTKSKARFAAKHGLTFPLLADPAHEVAEAYGVWQEKQMYGKSYMGVARVTYLIGPDGTVRRRWDAVKVDGHAAEVLAAVEA